MENKYLQVLFENIIKLNLEIKKIDTNTYKDYYSRQDGIFYELKNFDLLNNYYCIIFKDWTSIYIGDYNKIESDTIQNTIEFDNIKDILEEINFTISELNEFIKEIKKYFKI